MFCRLNPHLLRLSRWPRRIAALACLLLAAAGAWTPADGSTPRHPAAPTNPIATALRPGQVAVPVTVAAGTAVGLVRTGDHIGVYATVDERAGPALVADRLRVLTIVANGGLSDDAPVIVVAADRATASRLATLTTHPALVVVDKSP